MKKTGRINFRAAIITVLCTLLDLTGRYLAVRYKLPLWGDSLGTALAAYVLGPFSGAVVGALACIMLSFADYRTAFFSIVGIGIGLGTGFFARRGAFKTYFNAVTCAIAVTSYTFQGCFTKSNSVFRVYSDDKEIARSVFLLRKH